MLRSQRKLNLGLGQTGWQPGGKHVRLESLGGAPVELLRFEFKTGPVDAQDGKPKAHDHPREQIEGLLTDKPPIYERPLLTPTQATEVVALFRALASDSRLRLLHALARAEQLCVTDFATAVETTSQVISKQLRRLIDHPIVATRREEERWDYTRAIEFNPRLAEAYSSGLARLRQGKTVEAEQDFKRRITLNMELKPLLKQRIKEVKAGRVVKRQNAVASRRVLSTPGN